MTRAKFVDFEKTARSANQRRLVKQVNYKKCAEQRVIVWVLDAKFEYIPAFFAADNCELEINTA